MTISFLNRSRSSGGISRAYDPATLAFQAQVGASNISFNALANFDQFVFNLKNAGVFSLLDDFGFSTVENTAQTKSFLKYRALTLNNGASISVGTVGGGGTPGLVTDGISQYADNQFVMSTDCAQGTATSLHLSVIELVNTVGNTTAIGVSDSTSVNAMVRPHSSAPNASASVLSNLLNGTLVTQSSIGHTLGQRDSSTTAEVYKGGVSLTASAPTTNGIALPTHSLFVGAQNNVGTAGTFRASTYGFWSVGASMNGTQIAAFYAALKTYFTYFGVSLP